MCVAKSEMEIHRRGDRHRTAPGRRRKWRGSAWHRLRFLIQAGDTGRANKLDRTDVASAVNHEPHDRHPLTTILLGIRRHALEAREMSENSA